MLSNALLQTSCKKHVKTAVAQSKHETLHYLQITSRKLSNKHENCMGTMSSQGVSSGSSTLACNVKRLPTNIYNN
jgi:hypothetical protein